MAKADLNKCLNEAVKIVKGKLDPSAADEFDKTISRITKIVDDAEDLDTARSEVMSVLNEAKRRMADEQHVAVKKEAKVKELVEIVDASEQPAMLMNHLANLLDHEFVAFEARNAKTMLFGAAKGETTVRTFGDLPSVSNRIAYEVDRVMARLDDAFSQIRANPFQFQTDNKMAISVASEMLGIDTGDVRAQTLAATIKSEMDVFVQKQRDAGMPVGNEENFFPRTYDLNTIERDLNAWLDFMEKALDPAHHSDPRQAAINTYKKLAGSRFDASEQMKAVMRRELKFKTPDLELKHQLQWGRGTIADVLTTYMRQGARNSVLFDTFGPRPFAALDELKNAAMAKAKVAIEAGEGSRNRLKAAENSFDRRVEELKGEIHQPENTTLAAGGRIARSWAMMASMGKASLWNVFIDPIVHSMNAVGISDDLAPVAFAKELVGSQARSYKILFGGENKIDADILDSYGIFHGIMTGDALERFAPLNFTAQAASDGQTGFVNFADRMAASGARGLARISGLSRITNAQMRGTAMLFIREMTKQVGVKFDDLRGRNPELYVRLVESGVNAKTWDAFARSEHIRDGMLDLSRVKDYAVQSAIGGFMHREVRHSITTPDLMTRRLARFGGRKGTVIGEIGASALQYHSFAISFIRNSVARTIRRHGMSGLAIYAAPLMAAGALKIQLEEKVRTGRTLPMGLELGLRSFDASGLGYMSAAIAMGAHQKIVDGRDISVFEILGDEAGPIISNAVKATELSMDGMRDISRFGQLRQRTLGNATAFGMSLVPYNNALPIYATTSWLAGKSLVNMIADDVDPTRESRRTVFDIQRKLPK